MKRDMTLFIEDILECISLIEKSFKDLNKEDFKEDRDIQDATIRRIEVIGEAVKNIPENFRKKYPKIEWKKIAGLRDILIHAYFGINLERVWDIVKYDLPELKREIKFILKSENI
jgi:uncharacterized protein with HEPN domain